jgi:hypothetical protein
LRESRSDSGLTYKIARGSLDRRSSDDVCDSG